MVGYIVPYMEPSISPSTIMEAAFGRLHNSGAGAFGARPTVVESIMVDGEIDGSIYSALAIYSAVADNRLVCGSGLLVLLIQAYSGLIQPYPGLIQPYSKLFPLISRYFAALFPTISHYSTLFANTLTKKTNLKLNRGLHNY